MKKPLITLGCICALALPAIGLAGNSGNGSEYGTQPGFAKATANTPCAGHGAFGAFGKDNNFAGGADGQRDRVQQLRPVREPAGQRGRPDQSVRVTPTRTASSAAPRGEPR